MCEQNEPWSDECGVNSAGNVKNDIVGFSRLDVDRGHFTFENGDKWKENDPTIHWHTKGYPDISGRYLVGVKTDKGIKVEIAEYFRREDDYPNLRRWSMQIEGVVVCWAELPALPRCYQHMGIKRGL